MAGILANSTSVEMVDGDSVANGVKLGFTGGEEIALTVSGATLVSFVWSLSSPKDADTTVEKLDTTTGAAPKFTPQTSVPGERLVVLVGTDAGGNTTTYRLTIGVKATEVANLVGGLAITKSDLDDVDAPGPTQRKYVYDEATQLLRSKDVSGDLRQVERTIQVAEATVVDPDVETAVATISLPEGYYYHCEVRVLGRRVSSNVNAGFSTWDILAYNSGSGTAIVTKEERTNEGTLSIDVDIDSSENVNVQIVGDNNPTAFRVEVDVLNILSLS